MTTLKTIFYYSVMTGNRGDTAIRKAITEAIEENLNISFAFFNVKFEELTEERIVNQLNTESSCLIIAGSGLYTNYPKSSGWYFPCKTELFNKIKVPIFLVGLGCNNNLRKDMFNGILKDKAKISIQLINYLAKLSTVRDQRTYDILKSIGINNHELMLDPANFLKVPKIPKKKRVAINLAQHSPLLGRFDGGKEGQINREKHLAYFLKVCKFLKMNDYQVVFIAHDALEQSLIYDLKKKFNELEFINTDNIDEMLHEYASCEFSIGMKMHSNILSFASGTPFISLYYDTKSPEYLKLIDWSDFGKPIFDLDFKWLKVRMAMLMANNAYYTKQFRNRKQIEQKPFDELIQKICYTIKTTN